MASNFTRGSFVRGVPAVKTFAGGKPYAPFPKAISDSRRAIVPANSGVTYNDAQYELGPATLIISHRHKRVHVVQLSEQDTAALPTRTQLGKA